MRSMGHRDEDLTTKARIRYAALRLFPERGFGATTIREVAAAAGVSPGLVLHHYGSKEGLREDCDRYVAETFRRTKLDALEQGALLDPGYLSTAYQIAQHILRYLGWAMARNHPAANQLFDEMLRSAHEVSEKAIGLGLVVESADLRRRTAVQLSLQLGMLVLHRHLERSIGVDILDARGLEEVTPTLLEIFRGLFTPEAYDQIASVTGQPS